MLFSIHRLFSYKFNGTQFLNQFLKREWNHATHLRCHLNEVCDVNILPWFYWLHDNSYTFSKFHLSLDLTKPELALLCPLANITSTCFWSSSVSSGLLRCVAQLGIVVPRMKSYWCSIPLIGGNLGGIYLRKNISIFMQKWNCNTWQRIVKVG